MRSPGSGCFLVANQLQLESIKATSKIATATGRSIRFEPELWGECGSHLRRASAQISRCREVVGKTLVGLQRCFFVAELELGGRCQLECGRAPRIAWCGQRRQPGD